MSTELRRQVYESMDLRATDELLDIWQTNDRVEWSDEAFEVIGEILRSRGVELPQPNEPEDATYGFTDQELNIIDDENPPAFYDPFEVIRLGKWLNIAAIASIAFAVIANSAEYRIARNAVKSYFFAVPNAEVLIVVLTLLLVVVSISLQVLLTYLPLKALAHILRILMEMEFNSRKQVKPPE